MNDNLIERLRSEWANLDPVDPLRGLIRDAIAALSEARAAIERQSVPAGWRLVPIEPSDEWIARLESLQTGELEAVDADAIRQCIVELLAAAPQQQPVQEPLSRYREKCADGSWCLHGCLSAEACYTAPQSAQGEKQ